MCPGPEVITRFHAQLNQVFQLLIRTKMLKKLRCFLALKLPDAVFILFINFQMPTNSYEQDSFHGQFS